MKKIWKSKINRRLIKHSGHLLMAVFMLISGLFLGKTGGTNAFFMDTATVSGSSFTAGYWVVPEIKITNPAGEEKWQVGSVQNVSWTIKTSDPSATITSLNLEYKCGSGSYVSIQSFTNDPGHYDWTVPENISNDCKIKITATDSNSLVGLEESSTFEISWMVVLNEFVPNPSGDDDAKMPGGEWVELYNNGTIPIDANGWYLYDSVDTHELLISVSNSDNNKDTGDTGETIIPAKGWLVVYRNHDGDFELNNTGSDAVRLYDGAIATAHLLDRYDYTIAHIIGDSDPNLTKGLANTLDGDKNETIEGKSWARFPDGIGPWFDPVPTPGEKNTKNLDLDKFRKYYSERCIKDENVISVKKDPVCDVTFLTELGVLDAKKNVIPEIKIPIVGDGMAIPVDTVSDSNQDQTANTDTPTLPAEETIVPIVVDEPVSSEPAGEPVVSVQNPPTEEEKPKADVVVPEVKKEDPAPEVKEPEVKKEEIKVEEPKKEEPKEEVKKEEPKPDEVAEQI